MEINIETLNKYIEAIRAVTDKELFNLKDLSKLVENLLSNLPKLSKHLEINHSYDIDEDMLYRPLFGISKTQKSLSDNPALLGRPTGFRVTINELRLSAGAGFLVAMSGDIVDMPGLPGMPAAASIDVDDSGLISGLF